MREAPRRAQDHAHAFRNFELLGDGLETLAIIGIGDLARDAAAARRVGHQHRIATGERQIGGERRTLVAALLLDDLDQQDLAALDDFLNLVLPSRAPALGHFLKCVTAELLDGILVFAVIAVIVAVTVVADAVIAVFGGFHLHATAIGALFLLALLLLLAGGFILQKGLTIGCRNLVIIGVNLAEGEEAVAVAAILDEGCLERWLHAGDLREIDVTPELLAIGGFEVEFLDSLSAHDDDPGLLRVRRVDQHLVCHGKLSTWRRPYRGMLARGMARPGREALPLESNWPKRFAGRTPGGAAMRTASG